jgi:hypothetical protein
VFISVPPPASSRSTHLIASRLSVRVARDGCARHRFGDD